MSNTRITIAFPDGCSTEHRLADGCYQIGREAGDLVLADPSVSACHALLEVRAGRVTITDQGSSNGTFDERGQRLTAPSDLVEGHPIRLGACLLTMISPPVATARRGTQVMAAIPPPSSSATQERAAVIVKPPDRAPGLAVGSKRQYPFTSAVWSHSSPPAVDQRVRLLIDDDGNVVAIRPIPAGPALVSKASRLIDQAFQQTARAAAGLQATARQQRADPRAFKRRLAACGTVVALAAGVITIGASSSSALSEGTLEDLLEEHYAQQPQPECWTWWDKRNMRWPLEVEGEVHPILIGLARGHHISLERATRPGSGPGDPFFNMQLSGAVDDFMRSFSTKGIPVPTRPRGYHVVDLSEKGEADGVWSKEKNGFCIGQRALHEIESWTDPAPRADGTIVSHVQYTWTITDRPDWVGDEAFAGYAGLAEPAPARVTVVKTGNGWQLMTAPTDSKRKQ